MLYTTLHTLRRYQACERGYALIAEHVGVNYTGPISLETILDNNGLEDCLWSLRAAKGAGFAAAEFAIRCALEAYNEDVWVAWTTNWLSGAVRSSVDAARDGRYYAYSETPGARAAYAATYAAEYAAWPAAYAASYADNALAESIIDTGPSRAAGLAASYAANALADSRADASAYRTVRARQTEILRDILRRS
jgi:hypothetical protein